MTIPPHYHGKKETFSYGYFRHDTSPLAPAAYDTKDTVTYNKLLLCSLLRVKSLAHMSPQSAVGSGTISPATW